MTQHIPGVLTVEGRDSQSVPLVFDSPHSGTEYPDDFRHAVDPLLLRYAEDTHVQDLWAGAVPAGPTPEAAWADVPTPPPARVTRSYADKLAALLERELAARNIHLWRDETSLRAGEAWQAALARAAGYDRLELLMDEMVPVVRYASVGAIPIEQLIPKEKIDAIVKRTRGAGGEIVKLLGFSAYFSPAGAVADMVQSVVRDEKRVLPCSARLEGEYGAKDIYLGVPVMLGAKGMEKIFEVELNAEEKEMLAASVKLCTGSIDIARKLMAE